MITRFVISQDSQRLSTQQLCGDLKYLIFSQPSFYLSKYYYKPLYKKKKLKNHCDN